MLMHQDGRNLLSLDFDMLQSEAQAILNPHALSVDLETIANAIAKNNTKNLASVLGVNLRQVRGLGAQIDMFRDNNISLIRSLVGDQLTDIRSILESSEATGMRVEDLSDLIQKRFEVSDSRADLIARDQTLKLNGAITQSRQVSAGVEKYIWTTSGDERVREEHAALEGQVFSWSSPPEPGHPGEDIQCRCVAFPWIEELDGAVSGDTE